MGQRVDPKRSLYFFFFYFLFSLFAYLKETSYVLGIKLCIALKIQECVFMFMYCEFKIYVKKKTKQCKTLWIELQFIN